MILGFFSLLLFLNSVAAIGNTLRDEAREQLARSVENGYSHSLQLILPWEMREVESTEPNCSIQASPAVLERSGDRVTVHVERLANVDRRTDFLAAYTPAGSNVSAVTPARLVNLSAFDSYVSDGVVDVHLYLTNMRNSYDFVLFSEAWWCDSGYCDGWWYFGGSQASTYAVARSEPIIFAEFDEPRGLRVLPGRNGAWSLVWTSRGDTTSDYFCVVNGKQIPSASSQRLSVDKMCGSPANGIGFNCEPPVTHRVEVETCPPGTTIRYQCGSEERMTPSGSFSCEPLSGAPTTLAIFGDLGRGERPGDDSKTWKEYGSPAAATAALLATEEALDFVYHIGDISYAVGYLSVWDDFMDMMAPVTSRFKYGLNLGNHEFDYPTFPADRVPSYYTGYDSGGECGVSTLFHYPMPTDPDTPWWSRDIGLAHIIAMCTECDFRTGSIQWNWLQADLANVDRSKTPWIIFGGHRPGYVDSSYQSDNYNGAGDMDNMELWIENVEPLLLEHNVELAVWGHNHAVQRLCASAHGECVSRSVNGVYRNPPAPVHNLVGTGGASFTKNAYGAAFAEQVFYSWGYAKVLIHNATHLDWTFFDNGANEDSESSPGRVLDQFSIIKDYEQHDNDDHDEKSHILRDARRNMLVVLFVGTSLVVLGGFGLIWRARQDAAAISSYSYDVSAEFQLPTSDQDHTLMSCEMPFASHVEKSAFGTSEITKARNAQYTTLV